MNNTQEVLEKAFSDTAAKNQDDYLKGSQVEKSFKQRTDDWLSPLGYSVHSHNPDWTNITLMNYERLGENYPAITCRESDMTANLSYFGLKMLVSLQSNSLAFEHKDIARFIDVMKHYADTCEANPPF